MKRLAFLVLLLAFWSTSAWAGVTFTAPGNICSTPTGGFINRVDIVNSVFAYQNVPEFHDNGSDATCVYCPIGTVTAQFPPALQLTCNATVRDPGPAGGGSPSGTISLRFSAETWGLDFGGTVPALPLVSWVATEQTAGGVGITVLNGVEQTANVTAVAVWDASTGADCTGCSGGFLVVRWCRNTDSSPDLVDLLSFQCTSN